MEVRLLFLILKRIFINFKLQPTSTKDNCGNDQVTNQELSEVLVTAVLTRNQAHLRTLSRSWRLEDLEGCCILKLPPHVVFVLSGMRSSVFNSEMVPKSWAMEFCSDSMVQRHLMFMGHLDFRFPDTLTSHGMANVIDNVKGTVRHLLRLSGVTLEDQEDYQISDIFLHVCTHQHYHAAQISNMLRQLGKSIGSSDLIVLAREQWGN